MARLDVVSAIPARDIGPKLRKLTPIQRNFVVHFVANGKRDAADAYRKSGASPGENKAKIAAHVLLQKVRVQEAIEEECRRVLKTLVPLALARLGDVLENPQMEGPATLKAVQMTLDRAGLSALHQHTHVHEVGLRDDTEKMARIRQIAEKLGIPIEKLLGSRMALPAPVEDAEYEELYEPTDEGIEGLI